MLLEYFLSLHEMKDNIVTLTVVLDLRTCVCSTLVVSLAWNVVVQEEALKIHHKW